MDCSGSDGEQLLDDDAKLLDIIVSHHVGLWLCCCCQAANQNSRQDQIGQILGVGQTNSISEKST
jgi:hypothetical protein